MNELQTLREEFRQIACFIRELKRDYSVLEEKIELSTADVLHLLVYRSFTCQMAGS